MRSVSLWIRRRSMVDSSLKKSLQEQVQTRISLRFRRRHQHWRRQQLRRHARPNTRADSATDKTADSATDETANKVRAVSETFAFICSSNAQLTSMHINQSPPSNPPVNNPSPTPRPTRKPTAEPVEPVEPSASGFDTGVSASASDIEEDRSWTNIESEDFHTSFGIFNRDKHVSTKFLSEQKERLGVVRIENESTLTSGPISLLDGNTLVQVTLAAYVVVFEETDSFCLESSEDGMKWQQEKCWMVSFPRQGSQNPVIPPGTEYVPNKVWTDLSAEFAWNQSSVRLRFSCNGDHKHDDVLIDRVDIRASSS